MKLTNENELTQLEWEVDSIIAIVLELTGQKPSTEINRGQNHRTFESLLWGIRRHLDRLEKDHKGIK